MPKLKEVHVEGEKFFISLSFDSDDEDDWQLNM